MCLKNSKKSVSHSQFFVKTVLYLSFLTMIVVFSFNCSNQNVLNQNGSNVDISYQNQTISGHIQSSNKIGLSLKDEITKERSRSSREDIEVVIGFETREDRLESYDFEPYSIEMTTKKNKNKDEKIVKINGRISKESDGEFLNSIEHSRIKNGSRRLLAKLDGKIDKFLSKQKVMQKNDKRIRRGEGVLFIKSDINSIIQMINENIDDMEYIDLDLEPQLGIHLNEINRLTRVNPIAYNYGYTGNGIGIHVNEPRTPEIAPYVNIINNQLNGRYITQGEPVNDINWQYHSLAVSCVLASSSQYMKGVSPSANIFTFFGESTGRISMSILNNPTVFIVNNSWWNQGGNNNYDLSSREWDNYVYYNRMTVVFISGNDNPGMYVSAPNNAFNTITVGGYQLNQYFQREVIYTCGQKGQNSSVNKDRVKPEIVAPAVNINWTNIPIIIGDVDYSTVSGTSFAAPQVAGFAANMISIPNEGYIYKYRPELLKAAIMAGASDSIILTNESRIGAGINQYSDADKESPGGINFRNTAINNKYKFYQQGKIRDYFLNTNSGIVIDNPVTLETNQRYRVALAWSTDGTLAYYGEQPDIDLDLYVYTFYGSVIKSSLSKDNTYEVVDFNSGSNNRIKIGIKTKRFSDYMGNFKLGLSISKID